MQGKKKLIAFLAFAMYFLTGAACIVVGSSLPHLVKLYNMDLEKVVLLDLRMQWEDCQQYISQVGW